jgi:hypothetical protein
VAGPPALRNTCRVSDLAFAGSSRGTSGPLIQSTNPVVVKGGKHSTGFILDGMPSLVLEVQFTWKCPCPV